MKYLGKVTQEESDALQTINRRLLGIENLLIMLVKRDSANDPLNLDSSSVYHKLLDDYSLLREQLELWWVETSTKYCWTYKETDVWKLSYNSREVFLMDVDEATNDSSLPHV